MELAIPFETNCNCGWSSVYPDEVRARHMAQHHQSYRNLNDSSGLRHEAIVAPATERKIKLCICGEFHTMEGSDICVSCDGKRQDEFSKEIDAYYGRGRNL